MPLPIVFRGGGGEALTNYDYVDISDGTGVVLLYGATEYSAAATNYILTKSQVYSDTPATVNPGAMTFKLAAFNMPKVAKGTAYFTCSIYEVAAGAYGIKVQLKKDSGSSISNVSNEITSSTINGAGAYKMILCAIPLTQTNFKVGDILQCIVTPTGGGGGDEEIGHDPQGRNGTYITSSLTSPPVTTKMILYMPFKINL